MGIGGDKVNKTILIGSLLACVAALSFFLGVYAEDNSDEELQERIQEIDVKIKDKVSLMNIGQLRATIIEYSYCVNYEDYLESIDFPITEVDEMSCLNHLEEFLDRIQ